jgi:NAD(P)-dependent dehydrogenase (short-subunit alcohol dehydrogenase family)
VTADATQEAAPGALVAAAVTELGRLDGAFNNAGDVTATGPLPEIGGTEWHVEITQNLTSVFYCMKAEIPAILDSGSGGATINNASTGGVAGIPGMSPYVAAKHGVVGLTRSTALECADQGCVSTPSRIVIGCRLRAAGTVPRRRTAAPCRRPCYPGQPRAHPRPRSLCPAPGP